jgi:transposase
VQVVVNKKTEEIICTEFFNGKAHDGTIYKATLAVLKRILVLADSGYRGIQHKHANTQYPFRHAEDAKHLTDEERKIYNKNIARQRMKIEHIIGRTKRFGIARERYRNRRKKFRLRYNLICGIVNFEKHA